MKKWPSFVTSENKQYFFCLYCHKVENGDQPASNIYEQACSDAFTQTEAGLGEENLQSDVK